LGIYPRGERGWGRNAPRKRSWGSPRGSFFVAGTGMGSYSPAGNSPLPSLVRADAGSLAGWPLDLGGGSWELEQRSGRRSWSCSAIAPAQEQNIGRQRQWSRTPDTGSLRVDWPSCWRRAAAWGRGRRSCRRGERGRRAAALASISRIGKWLPRHFARYAETWRNRQTLGCWAVAGYRLTACAASRDVGNFGQLG
jgi:hypothetical protein